MDARTAVSILGNTDKDCQSNEAAANLRKAKRLTAKIPTIIGHMQNIIDGRELVGVEMGGDANLSHAGNLYYMMTGKRPSAQFERTLDVSLILYAEHDYNASTFASRVIAGTLSDMHGAVTGAIAALKGPLHGGANEAAMDMLSEMRRDIGPANDPKKIEEWMRRAFTEKRKLMGFGHRVYKNGDHRAPILHRLGRAIAQGKGPGGRPVRAWRACPGAHAPREEHPPQRRLPVRHDVLRDGHPCAQYTPIFVASRITGWAAHIMEQHANNRLIRPVSVYSGPALKPWSGA